MHCIVLQCLVYKCMCTAESKHVCEKLFSDISRQMKNKKVATKLEDVGSTLLTHSIIDLLTQPSNHAYSPLNRNCTYYHIEYDEQIHSHAA